MVKIGRSIRFADDSEGRDYLDSICMLRKYSGKTWRQVLDEDPEYVEWILTKSDVRLSDRLRDELTWALDER